MRRFLRLSEVEARKNLPTAITSRVGIAHHFAKPIAVLLCGQCPPYNLWLIDMKTAVTLDNSLAVRQSYVCSVGSL
jgi:hypothetical protein